jgi:hypothetical protein
MRYACSAGRTHPRQSGSLIILGAELRPMLFDIGARP